MKKQRAEKTHVKPQLPQGTSKLRFDFTEAARKAVKDHPELRRNTLFIDAKNDVWLEPSPIIEKIIDNDEMDTIEDVVKTARRLKTSFAQAVELDRKKTAHALIFHPDQHPLYAPQKGAADDFGSFDHETGHMLAPDTHDTAGENAADAYAMLRHLQRFGDASADAEYCGWKRALVFALTGTTSHVTTFTVDRIVVDAKTASVTSLTPKQTAAIARDYAKLHTPDAARLKELRIAFRYVIKKPPNAATFREIARIALRADVNSDAFYLSARILAAPLSKTGVIYNGNKITLSGHEWDEVRQRLEKKLEKLPPQHALKVLTRPAA
ncbi:MAG: hypothetical protein PW788_11640 [Micavibrio sp.]|nr:hypothetical protein [Micavibrio sp.]